tara:strand:- start:80 stop:328 length:249 start_codon:yes stop_codon:yes gene_type:complete
MNTLDTVLEDFYRAAASDNPNKLKNVHIPMSDVFYVQKAIEARTGHLYPLDHIERAMYLEGHLTAHQVKDPKRKRGYCSYDT